MTHETKAQLPAGGGGGGWGYRGTGGEGRVSPTGPDDSSCGGVHPAPPPRPRVRTRGQRRKSPFIRCFGCFKTALLHPGAELMSPETVFVLTGVKLEPGNKKHRTGSSSAQKGLCGTPGSGIGFFPARASTAHRHSIVSVLQKRCHP